MRSGAKVRILVVVGVFGVLIFGIGITSNHPLALSPMESPLATPSSSMTSPLPTPALPPSPTPSPTISPGLPNGERAILFVAQHRDMLRDQLKLVESTVTILPLTGVSLWRGAVLELDSRLHYLHEVFIREDTKQMVTGSLDPSTFWQAEEEAFRNEHHAMIANLAAKRGKVAVDDLEVAVGSLRKDASSEQFVWTGKAIHSRSGEVYRVAIDERGQELDPVALEDGGFTEYGKLEPRLFHLLPTLRSTEMLRVLLWTQEPDLASVNQELARLYPELKAGYYASGQPFDGRGRPVSADEKVLVEIRNDYNRLLTDAHLRAAEPILDYLKQRGFEGSAMKSFPGVFAKLPVAVIRDLSETKFDGLSNIYLGEIEVEPQMDNVDDAIQISSVWERGYTGNFSGWSPPMRLGVMDTGVVDQYPTHPAFSGKVIHRPFHDNQSLHAAQIAGVMFGNDPTHPEYRGVAYDSVDLVSVGIDDQASWQSIDDGLDGLVDNHAYVINISLNLYGYRDMHPSDRVLDYVVRYRDPTIAVIAGNNGNQPPHLYYVNSPGKAYNAITVGGFEDKNTPSWGDDEMWPESCYRDPYVDGYNPNYPREHRKPDVVAVGHDVTVIYDTLGDDYVSVDGTSYAAPQVAGLAALLIQRYPWLRTNPEAIKAIIMASALNEVWEWAGPYDYRDGAGGISAAFAFAVHDRGGWAHHIIHDITDLSDPSNVFNGNESDYDFKGSDTAIWDAGTNSYARRGERVRAVLCWNSNPDGANLDGVGTDELSTDLDLRIVDPDGALVPGASSLSMYNNCEISDFVAPKTGEYALRVKYYAVGTEGPDLGLGMAWLPIPQAYVPVVLNDYP
jgi:subtilisin family serine protease